MCLSFYLWERFRNFLQIKLKQKIDWKRWLFPKLKMVLTHLGQWNYFISFQLIDEKAKVWTNIFNKWKHKRHRMTKNNSTHCLFCLNLLFGFYGVLWYKSPDPVGMNLPSETSKTLTIHLSLLLISKLNPLQLGFHYL